MKGAVYKSDAACNADVFQGFISVFYPVSSRMPRFWGRNGLFLYAVCYSRRAFCVN